MAADTQPRFVGFVLVLIIAWIVAYWITPAPKPAEPVVSFQETPADVVAPEPAPPAPTPAEPPSATPFEEATGDPTERPAVIPPTVIEYTTQHGDSFQSIARREYGSVHLWRAIARANPGVDPNRLGPGRRIRIPVDPANVQGRPVDPDAETTLPEPESQYTEFIVSRGDTLSGIAKALYGRASLWPRIANANPGVNPDRLRPGTSLRIPPPPASD